MKIKCSRCGYLMLGFSLAFLISSLAINLFVNLFPVQLILTCLFSFLGLCLFSILIFDSKTH